MILNDPFLIFQFFSKKKDEISFPVYLLAAELKGLEDTRRPK